MKRFILIFSFLLLIYKPVYAADLPTDGYKEETYIIDKSKVYCEETEYKEYDIEEQEDASTFDIAVGSVVDNNLFLNQQRAYWDQYTNYSVYNKLSDKEKQLWKNLDDIYYEYLLTDKNYEYKQVLTNLDYKTYNELWDAGKVYKYCHPQFFFLSYTMGGWRKEEADGSFSYSLTIDPYIDLIDGKIRSEKAALIKDTLNKWNNYISQEKLYTCKTKKIHDLIYNKVEYNYNATSDSYNWKYDPDHTQSVLSVFDSNKTVCAGYTLAFSMLCNYAQIENTPIGGNGHIWNTLKINDNWYNVDLTWDDCTKTLYYFLVSDDYMEKTSHKISREWTKYKDIATDSFSCVRHEIYDNELYYGMFATTNDWKYIFYNLGDGKNLDEYDVTKLDVNFNNSDFPYRIPTKIKRTGYRFDSWSDELGLTIRKVVWISDSPTILYSNWKMNKYNIAFVRDSKKTTGTMKAVKAIEYDEIIKLPKCEFKRNGYNFIGWTTDKKGTEVQYHDENFVFKMTDKNNKTVKLYPLWEKIN